MYLNLIFQLKNIYTNKKFFFTFLFIIQNSKNVYDSIIGRHYIFHNKLEEKFHLLNIFLNIKFCFNKINIYNTSITLNNNNFE